MKIRNHRKYEWQFRPRNGSKLPKVFYRFKYKSDLMRFLNKNFEDALCGDVTLYHRSFTSSGAYRTWFVWYNDYDLRKAPLKIVLKQEMFRGSKYIFKPRPMERETKKYFAFSNKIINSMCSIYHNGITPNKAKNLVNLFNKRGFKDFTPTESDWIYINGHISDGIDFWHWSDRCNFLRMKTIIEYFKREKLIN